MRTDFNNNPMYLVVHLRPSESEVRAQAADLAKTLAKQAYGHTGDSDDKIAAERNSKISALANKIFTAAPATLFTQNNWKDQFVELAGRVTDEFISTDLEAQENKTRMLTLINIRSHVLLGHAEDLKQKRPLPEAERKKVAAVYDRFVAAMPKHIYIQPNWRDEFDAIAFEETEKMIHTDPTANSIRQKIIAQAHHYASFAFGLNTDAAKGQEVPHHIKTLMTKIVDAIVKRIPQYLYFQPNWQTEFVQLADYAIKDFIAIDLDYPTAELDLKNRVKQLVEPHVKTQMDEWAMCGDEDIYGSELTTADLVETYTRNIMHQLPKHFWLRPNKTEHIKAILNQMENDPATNFKAMKKFTELRLTKIQQLSFNEIHFEKHSEKRQKDSNSRIAMVMMLSRLQAFNDIFRKNLRFND